MIQKLSLAFIKKGQLKSTKKTSLHKSTWVSSVLILLPPRQHFPFVSRLFSFSALLRAIIHPSQLGSSLWPGCLADYGNCSFPPPWWVAATTGRGCTFRWLPTHPWHHTICGDLLCCALLSVSRFTSANAGNVCNMCGFHWQEWL